MLMSLLAVTPLIWVGVAVVLALAACSGGPGQEPMATEWTALEEAKGTLDAKRQELADLIAQAAVAAEAEGEGEAAEDEEADADDFKNPSIKSADIKLITFPRRWSVYMRFLLSNKPVLVGISEALNEA